MATINSTPLLVPSGSTSITTVPSGMISQYAGSSAPSGWLMADGSAISRTTYVDLFNVIGTTYGTGNGSTTFNLPDLEGRVPVGKASTGTFDDLNDKGGAETHTLTIAEMPAHTHNVTLVTGGGSGPDNPKHEDDSTQTTDPTSSTGGGGAHENMPPYIVVNYIIKT